MIFFQILNGKNQKWFQCFVAAVFLLLASARAYPSATLVDIKQPDYQVSVKYNNGNTIDEPEVATTTETLNTEKQADNAAKV